MQAFCALMSCEGKSLYRIVSHSNNYRETIYIWYREPNTAICIYSENRMDPPVTFATSACDLNGHNITQLNQRLVVIFVWLITENVYDNLRRMIFMNTKCDCCEILMLMYITSIVVHYAATGIGIVWINRSFCAWLYVSSARQLTPHFPQQPVTNYHRTDKGNDSQVRTRTVWKLSRLISVA
jgi:hypothetical protein